MGLNLIPRLDPAAPLLFVINSAAGALDMDAKRSVIEAALADGGRTGELLICRPAELLHVATQAAATAVARGTAVVAVGGDGSLNTVAQAAHAAGCAMGVVPYGTFNYFARTHGLPTDPAAAMRLLLDARPMPVQVAAINDQVFLVNASLGIYPELLQDREAYKARFGRSRWVAFVAACATLLRAQRRLRLHIEMGATVRDVQTFCRQQPAAVAAVRCRASRHPDWHAGQRQHGGTDVAADWHAVDDWADAAGGDGPAGGGRGR
jgi:diacylglycerol kinase family enzyme